MDLNTKLAIASVAAGWACCAFMSGRCYGTWRADVENGEPPEVCRIMRGAFIETMIVGTIGMAALLGWVLFR